MKKAIKMGVTCVSLMMLLAGCAERDEQMTKQENYIEGIQSPVNTEEAIPIVLSEQGITVSGQAISADAKESVYAANDIVYYEAGKDFTYGEGTEADAHTEEEAKAHTVVHITKPGTYSLSGALSAGQVAIDLGEGAEDNPEAVVNLVLDNVDITCTVAPAIIFYNVYECGEKDTEKASKDVDTQKAGANVIIADGTKNTVNGSYVARIYESYELNEEGTEVVDNEKLHKYDAALYSKRTMNVYGGKDGTGILDITAENEGLDSELHLTLNGGNINITSGNDGINTNEDGVSVTTVNGGTLKIVVNGSTGEGDGIDSNGWLVINGGTVIAEACSKSGDAGIDSDLGIHLNGGTVVATGNMLDKIAGNRQNYSVFTFNEQQEGGKTYSVKNEEGMVVAECTPANAFKSMVVSTAGMAEEDYHVWQGETKLEASTIDGKGGFGGRGERPDGMKKPDGTRPPDAKMPEDGKFPDRGKRPEGTPPTDMGRKE